MAAINFPTSPANGQLFTATTGIVYKWQSTPAPGLWVATSGPFGDGWVSAGNATFTPVLATNVPIVFPTVIVGNTGNWLNLTNGQYTPPFGKYYLQATVEMQAPLTANGTWILGIQKNAAALVGAAAQGSGSQQFSIPITVGLYVEASGGDSFRFVGNALIANMAVQGGIFTAFRVG